MKHGNKVFKKHKMYCKDGSIKNANTLEDHLKFKKMGCKHSPIRTGKGAKRFSESLPSQQKK